MGISIAPGGLIRQKYRVEKVLGEGGMGVVVAAWHLHLERRVAIKFLLPEMLAHPGVVERFLREGRAASAIEGEHVAKVIDVDTLEDGTPYLVMEHLDGFDLARLVENGVELPLGRVVAWVLEACEAVREAHRLGIVHRDLKPSNLFLAKGRDGRQRVKVLDFGISKVTEAGNKALTRTSIGMGSSEYMSPEQCLSARDVDARADVWALGVILYELLTLRVPFPGENATQVYARATGEPADPPSDLRPDVPEGLDAAILGCLEKDVAKRIPTVAALVEKLTPFAHTGRAEPYELDRGGSAVVDGPGAPHDATLLGSARERSPTVPSAALTPDVPARAALRPESATVAEFATSPGVARRRSWPMLAAVALGLALLVGAAVLLTRGGTSPRADPVRVAGTTTAASPAPPSPAAPTPAAPDGIAAPVVAPGASAPPNLGPAGERAPTSAAASGSGAALAPAPAMPPTTTPAQRPSSAPRGATGSPTTKSKTYDPSKEM